MKTQNYSRMLRNNMFLFKLCIKVAPGYTISFMAEKIRNALGVFLSFTVGFNYVLECVEFGRPFRDAALFLGILITFGIGSFLFNSILWQKIELKSLPKVKMRLKEQLYHKVKEIDLSCYDNPDFYNEYTAWG